MYGRDDGDTFSGAFIRTDGTRIPGTFTCDADVSCAAIATAIEEYGNRSRYFGPFSESWSRMGI